jgi:hypothetical protein
MSWQAIKARCEGLPLFIVAGRVLCITADLLAWLAEKAANAKLDRQRELPWLHEDPTTRAKSQPTSC